MTRRHAFAAARTFTLYANAMTAMAERIGDNFDEACRILGATTGKVVVSGVGKSGHVGLKISATLASTGTPAQFMHPTEAWHGDLGTVTSADTALLLSHSGETEEIVRLVPALRRMKVPVVAIVGKPGSTLWKAADVALDASVEREACHNDLAPTTSTIAAMAMGDALAVALSESKGFRPEDFARYHPGGSLGRKLLTKVSDVMRKESLPFVEPSTSLPETIIAMTSGRAGVALVAEKPNDGAANAPRRLVGIITDGDLRRFLQTSRDLGWAKASDAMTANPKTIPADASLAEAEAYMMEKKIATLVAVDPDGVPVGLVQIYD
jgi:arabinose-5-phosphate isomerase